MLQGPSRPRQQLDGTCPNSQVLLRLWARYGIFFIYIGTSSFVHICCHIFSLILGVIFKQTGPSSGQPARLAIQHQTASDRQFGVEWPISSFLGSDSLAKQWSLPFHEAALVLQCLCVGCLSFSTKLCLC